MSSSKLGLVARPTVGVQGLRLEQHSSFGSGCSADLQGGGWQSQSQFCGPERLSAPLPRGPASLGGLWDGGVAVGQSAASSGLLCRAGPAPLCPGETEGELFLQGLQPGTQLSVNRPRFPSQVLSCSGRSGVSRVWRLRRGSAGPGRAVSERGGQSSGAAAAAPPPRPLC